MASALEGYAAAAAKVATSEPTATLLSNSDGQPVSSAESAIEKLVAQLTRPVRWDLCIETLRQRNVTAVVEFPPRALWPALPSANFGVFRRMPSSPRRPRRVDAVVIRTRRCRKAVAVRPTRTTIEYR
ncbi:malonyl CoA-acyl carrier transacylase domain protein [Mycobacterium xenopi 3993]|nr:malonyl CoA-acyl carrier transacylase domain protein [Mycobacterium xenopi 3993]